MGAALCLHGFSGTPFEVQPLAEALTRAGYIVHAPLLPGHGGDADALATSTWTDWVAGASDGLTYLRDRTSLPVALVGASMGGLLAIRLACMRPADVAAIVLLAPPLRLKPFEEYGIKALSQLARAMGLGTSAVIPKTGAADVRDPAMRAQVPPIREYPISGLANLSALMAAAAADLPRVTAPALVVHGRLDQTVPLATSDEIAARLGSSVCEQLWLENSAHMLALDYDRDALGDAVAQFLARVLAVSRAE